MLHELKIKQCYLIHILEGTKTFEIRKNDRDFQIGDTIRFLPLADVDYNCYEVKTPIPNYRINYVLSGVDGLNPTYVGLAITPVKDQGDEIDRMRKIMGTADVPFVS